MKYFFTDFALLQGLPAKGSGTLGGVYEQVCHAYSATVQSLLRSLRVLTAGGYVTVEPENGVLTVSTPIALTDKGREAVTPKGQLDGT